MVISGHNFGLGLPEVERVFEPNQQFNLSDMTSDERDVEAFKRFDYYFEPPKDKLKVNLNVQDIYNSNSRRQENHSMSASNSPQHFE